MRILTIRQPWAWTIFDPRTRKDIENRDVIRSLLAAQETTIGIHTSQKVSYRYYEDSCEQILDICGVIVPPLETLTQGAIIGVVDTGKWVSRSPSRWFVGTYGLVIKDCTLFAKPVPAMGQLGLWTYQRQEASCSSLASTTL